jgi:hypothetical protein
MNEAIAAMMVSSKGLALLFSDAARSGVPVRPAVAVRAMRALV